MEGRREGPTEGDREKTQGWVKKTIEGDEESVWMEQCKEVKRYM